MFYPSQLASWIDGFPLPRPHLAAWLSIALGCSLAGTATAQGRTWTDQTGAFRVQAEMIRLDGQTVIIKRQDDGRTIRVPLARLSESDRRYALANGEETRQQGRRGRGGPDAALQRNIEIDAGDIPLSDMASELAKQAATNLFVDRRGLESVGISPEQPVSLRASGTLESALESLTDGDRLEYFIVDDVIMITSKQALKDFARPKLFRLTRAGQGRFGAGPNAIDFGSLIKQITRVAPKSWESLGGPGSVIPIGPSLIVVRQTPVVMRDITKAHQKILVPLEVPSGNNSVLEKPVGVDARNRPLREFLTSLAAELQTEISIDEDALQQMGLSGDVPVTITADHVPGKSVLNLALRRFHLNWTRDAAGLTVTTLEGMPQLRRQYSIADLRQKVAAPRLRQAILSTVDPSTWEQLGGRSQLDLRGTMLVISANDQVHRDIEALLATLRGRW